MRLLQIDQIRLDRLLQIDQIRLDRLLQIDQIRLDRLLQIDQIGDIRQTTVDRSVDKTHRHTVDRLDTRSLLQVSYCRQTSDTDQIDGTASICTRYRLDRLTVDFTRFRLDLDYCRYLLDLDFYRLICRQTQIFRLLDIYYCRQTQIFRLFIDYCRQTRYLLDRLLQIHVLDKIQGYFYHGQIDQIRLGYFIHTRRQTSDNVHRQTTVDRLDKTRIDYCIGQTR